MDELHWRIVDIDIDEDGRLLIEAEPWMDNRKKWQGRMVFNLSPVLHARLRASIEQLATLNQAKEFAKEKMANVKKEIKKIYLEKKQAVAQDLGLPVSEVPKLIVWDYGEDDDDIDS